MIERRRSKTALFIFLAISFALLAAIAFFLLTLPRPLLPSEQPLVGAWHAVLPDGGEKDMTFHADRTVDITNTGVAADVVFRWRLDGSRLMIKEGKGPWDEMNGFNMEGPSGFSIGVGQHIYNFEKSDSD